MKEEEAEWQLDLPRKEHEEEINLLTKNLEESV